MWENWLKPLKKEFAEKQRALANWQFGKRILSNSEGQAMPDVKKHTLALVGLSAEEADAVRSVLYHLSFPFDDMNIVDLGNLHKSDIGFVVPFLSELLQGDILPILIGHTEGSIWAQYQAYHIRRNSVNMAVVDEQIHFAVPRRESDYLNKILEDNHLFNISLLAYQAHYIDPSVLQHFERKNYELVRLGKIRANSEEVEPIIRDADLVSISLSALKMSDAPAQLQGSPSGLTSEEACQIARYAGMSDKLTSFGIYGFRKKLDRDQQTAQVIAQMIWYFLDGYANRKQDFPIQKAFDQLTQYIVEFKNAEERLIFWRSNKSGRWWMEIPVKTRKKHERHRLIPCSYNDYLLACNDDLPERLLNAYRRFT
jgi:formiminoglutamase